MNYLLESQKDKFKNLDEVSRLKVISGYETYKFASPREAQILFESFISTEKEVPLWEQEMPAKYFEIWNSLTESQKDIIKGQASLRVLDKPHQINHFWMTRDLRMFERQNSGLTNKNSTLINESNQNKNNSFLANVELELKRRFAK
jgi:Lhr-like helicase